MKNKVLYEWDFETVDDGEILDHCHADKLSDFTEEQKTKTLVLVRDSGNEAQGLESREWAYVTDCKLPEYFQDANGREGAKVPDRFHKELAKYLNNQ